MHKATGKIMVAMSGGVDSSVAALLLQRQGLDIAGMFMKNWEEDDRFGECSSAEDAADARAVAESMGLMLHTRNFATEYWENVFEEFLDEYRAGRTPNPDILCNREIKFKTFLEHAEQLGADMIATGHYVRSDCFDGKHRLLRGIDHNKDQSYFLYAVGHQQLEKTLFPVGELEKPKVRELAEQAGFNVFNKKDSTGICFIGERNFTTFLSEYLPAQPGEIRTTEDQAIGEHQGLMFHTLGQRQGLGIGGVKNCPEAPWYVLHKDMDNNILYVGQDHQHPWMLSNRLEATQLAWVSGIAPEADSSLMAKVRYRQQDQSVSIEKIDENRMHLIFQQAQRAVTPGQSVVLYDGDICLGGGIIESMNTPPMGNNLKW
ncbi:MAG: tRNA 2-thiouridine(34) synthase MnmA [Xanthomonadales bacterium]|nr:tRNA 2-thiouridine(34) synthase MnmA [Xanthomonadales bacterium]